jgi:hypothetical protein
MRIRTCARAYIFSFLAGVLTLLGPVLSFAQVQSEMKVFSDSFISPAFEATEKTNYEFIGAGIKSETFSEDLIKMDVAGGVAVGAPLLNYLNISEFYFEERFSESERLYIGRKKMNWNELDSRWNFSLWEPLFKWNPLAPDRQGLMGLFWQIDRPYFSVTLYGSPFYIPDQGPSFEIENGEFVRGNPWMRTPPASVRIFNDTSDIEYQFDKPNESQIILHSSFGGSIRFGDPEAFNFQMSYVYKPANQLALGYDGKQALGPDKSVVTLHPQVFYHSLTGADMSYKIKRMRFGVSAVYDKPNKDKIFDDEWTAPVFEEAFIYSPFVDIEMPYVTLSLQHIGMVGGEVTETGELASADRAPLTSRYPFHEANQVSLTSNFSFGKARRLSTRLSYTESQKNDFSLIRLNARLRLSRIWSFFSEMQMVEAGEVSVDNQNEIAQFANNDRFMLGVGYDF